MVKFNFITIFLRVTDEIPVMSEITRSHIFLTEISQVILAAMGLVPSFFCLECLRAVSAMTAYSVYSFDYNIS